MKKIFLISLSLLTTLTLITSCGEKAATCNATENCTENATTEVTVDSTENATTNEVDTIAVN